MPMLSCPSLRARITTPSCYSHSLPLLTRTSAMSTKQPDTLYETRGAAKVLTVTDFPERCYCAPGCHTHTIRVAQEAQEGKLKGAAEAATHGELKARAPRLIEAKPRQNAMRRGGRGAVAPSYWLCARVCRPRALSLTCVALAQLAGRGGSG